MFPLANEPIRNRLPALKDPNEKFSVWSLIKDCIGKDLSKIAVPGIIL